ncbi:acyl-CoA/acyl-ACP dehydrogenase [Sneathiella sp. CAU 1612]|uniref:Acyl-CoA/acyl-ACP dehydrogenase n=1 Tax=Sneathiella sedimenti TaxID=2816034 RepID=A0ABS3F0I2_9PROT|nr:acyl-CoA dehydrogenase family protein [Sneathiella sedimenti]MBO0332016.1 acyl-CoA/acyl-ACP dehydrogenase [Sneathiella sedimenti]
MEFGLSQEQLLIQDSFRGTLERLVTLDSIRTISNDSQAMDNDLWKHLVELGLPGLLVEEEDGGTGLSLFDAAVVAIELGRSMAPVPFVATAVMAPLALKLAGSTAQRKAWLPEIASGKTIVGMALADSVTGAGRGTAVTAANNRLKGRAPFTLDAAEADVLIMSDAENNLYLVRADASGLERVQTPTIDGTRPLCEIMLEDVAAEPLEGNGKDHLAEIINAGRIILAAESFGASEEMLRRAVDYAKERRQFDRVIGSFQAVKHLCAEMAAELQPCQSLIWYAAYAFDRLPEEAQLSGLLAKSHMDEIGRFVARTATEVHGGMGYTDLMGLHFWFKRIGFNRAQLGTPEKLRALAADLQGLTNTSAIPRQTAAAR